jgi:anti-sigma regulatory factor (Ser/Thr protein kinase)
MGGSILERTAGTRVRLALERDHDAPGAARHAFDLLDHGLDYARQYAVKLLVSELVSNSVKYGGDGPVHVEIEVGAVGVHVEVIDCGPGFKPARRNGTLEDVGGWGLVLVEHLASRWGSSASSCRVWFEIDRAAL